MADELIVAIERRFSNGVTVAAEVRVALRPGEILVLFGPSASGKTTILRTIAGLEHPERGSIRFDGEAWVDTTRSLFVEPQRRRIGCVFQHPALFPHLTVRQNVEYGLTDLSGAEQSRRSADVMTLVELTDLAARYPRQLSGGQAQRVALARALAPRPRLLLLDEPFTALDAPARGRLRGLVRESLQRLGIAAVLVTHDRSEAISLGDQMAVLAEGRIRQVGTVAEVFRRPADVVVARSVGIESVIPARIERARDGLIDLRVGATTLRAVEADLDPHAHEVFACIRAEDVTIERGPASRASARNHLAGRIISIDAEGAVERLAIDCGFPLAALVTRQACEEMALQPGTPVIAAIKATAIHVVARS